MLDFSLGLVTRMDSSLFLETALAAVSAAADDDPADPATATAALTY